MSFAVLSRKGETPGKTKAASALRVGKPDDAFEQDNSREAMPEEAGLASPSWSLTGITIKHPRRPPATPIQTKLEIGEAGDEYEKEADHVSDHIMRMPEPQLQRSCACGGQCAKCQADRNGHEHRHLQTKPVQAREAVGTAPPIVIEVLGSSGSPLDADTRKSFEGKFGRSFGSVRVHADERAAVSARAVNAQAFTVNHHIVFGAQKYAPSTLSGKSLLAHELTHVLQQTTAGEKLQHAGGLSTSRKTDLLQRKPDDAQERLRALNAQLSELKRQEADALAVIEASDKQIEAAKTRLADASRALEDKKRELAIQHTKTVVSQLLFEQAEKRAANAAIAAEQARKSARRWIRFAGAMKGLFHSAEAYFVCQAAFTTPGAIGCIHATTSLYADLNEISSGELTPNLFFRSLHDPAKALGASERQANILGGVGDIAGGGISTGATVSEQAIANATARTVYDQATAEQASARALSALDAAGKASAVPAVGDIASAQAGTAPTSAISGAPVEAATPSSISVAAPGNALAQPPNAIAAAAIRAIFRVRLGLEATLKGAGEHVPIIPGTSEITVPESAISITGRASVGSFVARPTTPALDWLHAPTPDSPVSLPYARGPATVVTPLSGADLDAALANATLPGVATAASTSLEIAPERPGASLGTPEYSADPNTQASTPVLDDVHQPKYIEKILAENASSTNPAVYGQLQGDITSLRRHPLVPRRVDDPVTPRVPGDPPAASVDVQGGTLASVRTNVDGLEGRPSMGASPQALPDRLKGRPGTGGGDVLKPTNPISVDHAEQVALNNLRIRLDILLKGASPAKRAALLQGKSVWMLVEQEPCSSCGARTGVLVQFSKLFPELTIEVKNQRTFGRILLKDGKRL